MSLVGIKVVDRHLVVDVQLGKDFQKYVHFSHKLYNIQLSLSQLASDGSQPVLRAGR